MELFRDKISDSANEIDGNDDNKVNINKTITSKSFEYKTKLINRGHAKQQ